MSSNGVLDVKIPDEKIFITADFVNLFDTDVLVDSAVVTCSVYKGTDGSPSSMVSGSASIEGKVVSQFIIGGNINTIYLLNFSATGSDGSIIDIQLLLPVQAIRLG